MMLAQASWAEKASPFPQYVSIVMRVNFDSSIEEIQHNQPATNSLVVPHRESSLSETLCSSLLLAD